MPKRRHSAKRPRESGWLSITNALTTAADTAIVSNTVAIPILQFSDTYNAIEVYKVKMITTAGSTMTGFIGTKTWAASTAAATTVGTDKTTAITIQDAIGDSNMTDLTDDLGTGVIIPAQNIVFSAKNIASTASSCLITVYYRLKKVTDADLVTMLNQYLVT